MTAPQREPTDDWRQERERLGQRLEQLRRQGICYQCHNVATGGAVFGEEYVLYDDALFRVVLEPFPRARGHTIVVYKPHREDLSALSEEEAGWVFALCVRMVRALKAGLGAEKVYLNTMCDSDVNHLHLQLLPRHTGARTGSTVFVAPRGPLVDGPVLAAQIRRALDQMRHPLVE
jgi:diadenosine tetraphosphate (Ap4A) HIT family hydrolase